ncbi:MAG: VPS10 domain-containing protein [Candidatus Kapaibacterium sp.]
MFPLVVLSVLALLPTSKAGAQASNPDEQRWVQMMCEPNANFFTIQREFNEYWSRHERAKGDGWKAFKRWEYFWERRVLPDGSFPSSKEIVDAVQKKLAERAAKRQSSKSNRKQNATANFTLMGPMNNIPTNGGCGRLNNIAFHPTNSNIMFVGAPAGGLWKTTTNGASWTTNTDQFPTLGVSAIAIDPSNPNVMYIGTGDRDHVDSYGTGIYKSTDGGSTWNTTGFTYTVQNQVRVCRLIIHPTQTNIIIAAASNGIWKSTNGGTSWSQRTTSFTHDMVSMPGNPNYMYASASGNVVRSTNNGDTWTAMTMGYTTSAVNRVSLAVTPHNPRIVYALCSNASGSVFYGLYRSLDTGNTWSLRSNTPNVLGGSSNGSDTRGQGWYDLCMAVNPSDSNDVFVGGINTWRSTNGGTNWTCKSMWYTGTSLPYVHADEHDMWYKPNTQELYVCSDGGLFRTTNGGTSWTDLSAGLEIMQFYRISNSASNAGRLLGGAQDNGTNFLNNGGWAQIYGGDGMDNATDQSNDAVIYASSQNGNFGRSTNSGTSFTGITPSGLGGTGSWVTPICLDANNNVYVAYGNVHRSTNRGTNWTNIGGALSSAASYMAVSRSDSNVIVIGTSSTLIRTTNAGGSWASIKGTVPNGIARVAIHPSGPDTMVAVLSNWTASNKVFRTTNGGSTWTNISGSLPNIPMNCLTFEAGALSGMYLGTDIGVYYRNNTMSDWVSYDDGLPNVPVEDIEIYTAGEKVRVGTYGRGAWQGDVYRQGPRAIMSASRTTVCVGDTLTLFDNSTNATSRVWSMPGASPSTAAIANPIVTYATPGTYGVTLIATNSFSSDTLTNTTYITVNALPVPTVTATKTSACSGDSIVISAPSGMKSYLWSTGESTSSVVLRAVGTYQVSVTITNNQNCSATSTPQNFTVYASPTTVVSGTPAVCVGESGSYSVGVVTPGSVYRWSRPRLGLIATGDTTSSQFTVNWNTAGRDTLFFRETNVNGCTVDRFIAVTVNPLPSVTLTGPANGCKGSMQTFSTSAMSAGATIEWLAPKLGSIIGANNNPSGVNIRWNTTGPDTIMARVTSAFGCVSQSTFVFVVNELPTVSITGPTEGCKNTLQTFATANLTAGALIQWSNPSRGIIVGSSTNTAGVNILWTTAGNDSVVAVVTSPAGCTAGTSVMYAINEVPDPRINGASAVCVGQEAVYQTPASSGHTYVWQLPAGASFVADSTTNSVRVKWNSTVKDSVRVTEKSANGCATQVALYVEAGVPSAPTISGMREVCVGSVATYSVPRAQGSTYAWSSPRKGVVQGSSNTDVITVQWNSLGADTVTLSETNAAGCNVTAMIPVNIQAQLKPGVASVTGKYSFCPGESITLQTATGYSQYIWKKNGTDAGSNTASIVVREAGTYSVFVSSSACSGSSDDISVTAFPATPKPVISKEQKLVRCTTPAALYQWYVNNVIVDGATNSAYEPTKSGNICVKITDENGCTSEVECVDFIVSVDESGGESGSGTIAAQTRIEPNPVDDSFGVILADAGLVPCTVRILDLQGVECSRASFASAQELSAHRFSMSGKASGVYMVAIDISRCLSIVLKVVKM